MLHCCVTDLSNEPVSLDAYASRSALYMPYGIYDLGFKIETGEMVVSLKPFNEVVLTAT